MKFINDFVSEQNRLSLVKKSVLIFFLIGLLMSYNLWLNDRRFPLFPVFDYLVFSKTLGWLLFVTQLILLSIAFFSKNKKVIWLIFVVFIFSLVQDQLRFQPWVYFYLISFLPLLFLKTKNNDKLGLSFLRCLIIGIYLWSGIHKFNEGFIEVEVENISVNAFRIYDVDTISLIKSFGYIIPLFEILTGFFLWFSKTRRIGFFMSVFLHLFVLYYLSPFSMDGNYIVYPWNIEMIILVFLLFYDYKDKIIFEKGRNSLKTIYKVLLIIILGLPILNFVGLYDHFPSFSLYSAKPHDLYMITQKPKQSELEYVVPLEGINGGEIISLGVWIDKELNVPIYPESRIFKSFKDSYKKEEDNNIIFIETSTPIYARQIFNTYGSNNKKTELNNLFYLTFESPIYLDTTSIKVIK